MKHLLTLTFLSIFGLTYAQIPSYVPSNGLVGWWPFNGNANDESGNGNNGTVNGAILTNDRNGVTSSAYSFDGIDDKIVSTINNTLQGNWSLSFWYKSLNNTSNFEGQNIIGLGSNVNGFGGAGIQLWGQNPPGNCPNFSYTNQMFISDATQECGNVLGGGIYDNSDWYNVVVIKNNTNYKIVVNNVLFTSTSNVLIDIDIDQLIFGNRDDLNFQYFKGAIDDIGIWNRALTEAEILALYEGCQLAITTQPQDQSVATSVGTASFAAASSSTNATYQWQTNLGLGYQNVSNAGQYSGATSATLTVSNLSMANDNQVFRCIVNDGSCADTTAEATLTIIDDAGIQTTALTSLKLYPNPVQDVIHIDGLAGKEFEYEVLSIEGKLLQKGKSQGEIAVKELRKGNYVLRIGEQQVSFVKQ